VILFGSLRPLIRNEISLTLWPDTSSLLTCQAKLPLKFRIHVQARKVVKMILRMIFVCVDNRYSVDYLWHCRHMGACQLHCSPQGVCWRGTIKIPDLGCTFGLVEEAPCYVHLAFFSTSDREVDRAVAINFRRTGAPKETNRKDQFPLSDGPPIGRLWATERPTSDAFPTSGLMLFYYYVKGNRQSFERPDSRG